MDAITYEVKRAHWRGTWHAIRKFRLQAKKIGYSLLRDMTPARFDVLHAVWHADAPMHEERRRRGVPMLERRLPMPDVRKLLGLAGPTISRTAHCLEKLGYVRIVPNARDRRAVDVIITWRGARLLRMAVQCVFQHNGMRDCLRQHVMNEERIVADEPGAPERTTEAHGVHVQRWHRYARFFWCKAIPIYDPRFVVDTRAAAIFVRPHHLP